MNLLRQALFLVTCTLASVSSFAQANTNAKPQSTAPQTQTSDKIGKVSGKLFDASNQPVSYATVTLLRQDSSVVNGDLTQDDGSFSIPNTGVGTFMLRISAIGLDPKTIPNIQITADAPNKNMGKVKVASSSTKLKEVAVVGERPIMEMKVDKKVFNVEKNTTTAGGSAADVLQNVPSVSVDVDGNVSLRGKQDVTILIDGKPSTLLGTDAASALQSLPASSIESVEVITNPSAKYDAQGLTGIINIITKKDGRLGINGTATIGAGTNDKYNGNLGLNLRKGKWNVFLNSSFRLNANYNRTTISRQDIKGDSLYSHSYENSRRQFDGFFNSIGATYDFDKNNSITFTQNVNSMDFGYKDPSYNNVYTGPSKTVFVDSTYRYSQASGGPLSFSSALDYKRKFKKQGEELSIDATISTNTISRSQIYNSQYFNTNLQPFPYSPVNETAPSSGSNGSFNAWADYTDPLFTKNGKLGFGWKSQVYWYNSHNNPLVDSGTTVKDAVDNTLLNNFNYSQQIHAGYVNWNDQLGKFSYQAGLRAEYASYNGTDYAITTLPYNNSYFDLFPSAFVSYQLPNQQSIYLNYSRRTNRPSFWELLPYLDLSVPGIISKGNPGVVPEFIHNVELSYSKQDNKGDNIILSTYYQYTQNLIARVDSLIQTGPQAGSIFRQPENLASGITYGFEGTAHLQLLPIWDATISVNLFQNEINIGNSAETQYLSDESGFSWIGKANTNIKLPGNFSLQLNGNYESPKVVAQGKLQEVYWLDAALRKNLWKNKATVVLNCSDIFNTRKYTTLYSLSNYTETYYRDRETRVGNLTFTYRFGKTDLGKNAQRGKSKDNPNPLLKDKEDRENNLKGDEKDDQGGGGSQGGQNGGQGGGGNKGISSGGTHN